MLKIKKHLLFLYTVPNIRKRPKNQPTEGTSLPVCIIYIDNDVFRFNQGDVVVYVHCEMIKGTVLEK